MEFTFSDVNEAFDYFVRAIQADSTLMVEEESRNGPVLKFPDPVLVTYTNPLNRVLFNSGRDCNPFFHLYEALWMLAGRNDVASLAYYNSNISNYSDDGITFHGAYGYRWRNHFGYDQLDWIADELKANPESRRCNLQMWDAGRLRDNGEQDECTGDLYFATHGGKDIPCNTNAYFSIRETHNGLGFGGLHEKVLAGEASIGEPISPPVIDMTVCNRSNDMIWGMLGANYVHFSMLLEYMAAKIGVEVGRYHHFTNNLHVYKNNWKPEKWSDTDLGINLVTGNQIPLVKYPEEFDRDLQHLWDRDSIDKEFKEPFFVNVALPMIKVFQLHKERQYHAACHALTAMRDRDWFLAATRWIQKRKTQYEAKNKSS